MTTALDRFAARLRRVEKELLARKSPQLANSSIEDGALRVNAADGTEMMVIGKQFDGTQTTAILGGPVPPTPVAPTVEAVVGGLRVAVDGLFADGSVVPMDFSRFEVHISTNPTFEPDPTVTLKATLESPRGGEQLFSLPYVPHYVRIVTRSQSGKGSAGSAVVSATPRFVEAPDLSPDIDLGSSSDGAAPTTAPTVYVNPFAVGSLMAFWEPVANPDPVSYRVYVSTSPIPDVGDPSLDMDLFNETADTQVTIPGYMTSYDGPTYVRVLAFDADGDGPLSVQATGTPLKVDTSDVGDDVITAAMLTAGSVETDKLAANSVTTAKIESGSITADKIDAGAVTADKLDAGAVTADKIAAGAIDADKITANTITQRLLSARPGGGSMVNIVPDSHFRDSYVNSARLTIANSLGGDGSTNTTGWAVRTITNLLPSSAASWTPGPKVASIDSTIWDDARVPTSKQIFFTLNADAVAGDVLMTAVVPLPDLTRAIDMNSSGLDWQLEYLNSSNGVLRTETGSNANSYGGNTVFHASYPQHPAPPAGTGSVRVTLKAPAAMPRMNGGNVQTYNAGACVLWTTAGVGAEPGQGVFYWDVANPAVAPTRYCDIVKGIPLVENTPLDITVGFSSTDASGAAAWFFVQANYEAPDGTRLLQTPQTQATGRGAATLRFPAPPPGATQLSLTVGNNSNSPTPTRVEVYSVDVQYVSSLAALSDVVSTTPNDGQVLGWSSSTTAWAPVSMFEPGDLKASMRANPSPGWLLCDGSSYPTASYPGLFAAIGYTHGGSGATFNVPDARKRSLIGVGSGWALGASDGELEANRDPAGGHSHTVPNHEHFAPGVDHLHSISSHTHGAGSLSIATVADRASGSGNRGGNPVSGRTGAPDQYPNTGAADRGLGAWTNSNQLTGTDSGGDNPRLAVNVFIKT